MSKRKVQFDDSEDYGDGDGVGFKKKHSLDSDEEDEDKSTKYDILAEDDLEGQEAATIDYDGETKITPFNMQEEMEEGHFDKDGNYFIHKDENEIRDNWLDNIDWIKIKPSTVKEDSNDSNGPLVDEISSYRAMLEIMQPGENVIKSLKRLGGTGETASNRWKKKKMEDSKDKSEASSEDKEKLLQLTELADQLLHSGKVEIYQATYEKIAFTLQMKEGKHPNNNNDAPVKAGPQAKMSDDALDMFAEVVTPDILQKKEEPKAAVLESDQTVNDNEINWEFKWENTDTAPVYGPHNSSVMHQWVLEDYFPDGVWVRRTSQPEAPFYNSKRIDFELYY